MSGKLPTIGTFAGKTSNHWNFLRKNFQSLELLQNCKSSGRSGSALIVALWTLLILTLMIGTFAFNMHIEAGITSHYRKRVKAQYLARAGGEWAQYLLAQTGSDLDEETEDSPLEEDVLTQAKRILRGNAVYSLKQELGAGTFSIDIIPEEGRGNINQMTDEQWEEMLDQAGVPEEQWEELIDCFADWIDENDEHHLNGAESDDPFYKERGYECKNAPLDTVDELLLIKGFTAAIVYGGPAEREDDAPYRGIASMLTVWGDGKININTATRETMLAFLPGIDEWMVDDIIEGRKGLDGEENTDDDGFESVDEAIAKAGLPADLKGKITTVEKKYVRVVSIGEVGAVKSGIWAVMRYDGGKVVPVFWREEMMQ